MENVTTLELTAEELTQQIEDMKNAEQSKAQHLQMQTKQLQERLQQTIAAKASTLGQIAELKQTAKEIERTQHQIEGALNISQALTG